MEKIDYSYETVQTCIENFNKYEELKESVLTKAFSGAPNTDLETVLIRVTLLNTFYSTRLNNNAIKKPVDEDGKKHKKHIDVESMAKHIAKNPNLDVWIKSQNEDEQLMAFDYIATELSEYKTDNHYAASSFASKYCSWCNPESFPIMDSYSRGMLYRVNAEIDTPFYTGRLSQDGLRDYPVFRSAHRAFRAFLEREHNKLYSAKEIDKYLWYYGTQHPEVAIE